MQYLGDLLHEKHHKIRMKAARALHDIGGEESADYLIGLLADKNEDVQALARSFLSAMDIDYVKKALHDAEFRNLITGLGGRVPEREKTAQRIGAEKIREGLPLLHRACRDKYKGVRREALKSWLFLRSRHQLNLPRNSLAINFTMCVLRHFILSLQ
jgi:HEAT repeat protein